jgi:hypothetical protein
VDPTAVVVVDSALLHVTVLLALELLSLLRRLSTDRNMWEYIAMRNAASEQKKSDFRQRSNLRFHEVPGSVIDLDIPCDKCDRRDTVPLLRSQVSADNN